MCFSVPPPSYGVTFTSPELFGQSLSVDRSFRLFVLVILGLACSFFPPFPIRFEFSYPALEDRL